MKRTMIAACLLAGLVNGACAQDTTTTPPPVTTVVTNNPGGFYIRGGLNLANISIDNNGGVNDANTLATFNAGFTADIPVSDFFSFQAGLLFNSEGSKTTWSANAGSTQGSSTFNPYYIQLPVNLVLKFPVTPDTRFFVGAGPYVQMGVGGTSKTESTTAGATTSNTYDIQFNNDDPTTSQQEDASMDKLKRFDVGLNGLAGIETGGILIGVNYELGLTKINSTQTNNGANDNNKFRTFSVNIGFRL